MTVVFIFCFIVASVGIVLALDLTPKRIGQEVSTLFNREQSLRERALLARGKKKQNKLLRYLEQVYRALADTGKEGQFGVACALSLLLMAAGCIIAVAINNLFLAPVLAVALATVPFVYLRRTVDMYEDQIRLNLETTLQCVTSSYERTRNLETAVQESLQNIKPPIRGIFEAFLAEINSVTPDVETAITHMKEQINDVVFEDWCDGLIACQGDNQLIDTLSPIVERLRDMKLINSELKVTISENRREYLIMALMVVANIPLLYVLNKDWYAALMYTTFGKVTLAICGLVILITWFLLNKYTKPVEYKR